MGLLDRLKARLGKTRSALSDRISGLFRGGRQMDAALLSELEEMLYTSDLGPAATELVAELSRLHKRGEVKGEDDVRRVLRETLTSKLQGSAQEIELRNDAAPGSGPTIVLVVGVNGSGKTTSIAKLAHRYIPRGKRVLIGACDTFRAAAADQLEIWAERTGAEIVRRDEGADPAAVAFDTVARGVEGDFDLVLIDTAGRLHTQKNLMEELKKVRRVIGRGIEGAPHEVLLVIDGTNGQNAIQQAKLFTEAVDVTGLIVAKLDGTARGGAIFGIREALGLPVRYIGTGESMELLEPFDPEPFVAAILGIDAAPA